MEDSEIQHVPQLPSNDITRFEHYLEVLGLPNDHILASPKERQTATSNFPGYTSTLSPEVRKSARYLSKFAAAITIGLFDAALNYVWNEVIVNLRLKVVSYGLDMFFNAAVDERHREFYSREQDLAALKDKVLLDTCLKLELLPDVVHTKLTHILVMRNDVGASHPNDSSIKAFELLGWLQVCVEDIIQTRPSDAAIHVKSLVDKLKNATEIIDTSTLNRLKNAFRDLHTNNIDNLLQAMFGMYAGSSDNILRKNISELAPPVWAYANDEAKYKLGLLLDGYKTNLHKEKAIAGEEFFQFCDGNNYKTLTARVIDLSGLVDELKSAHNGWDNFYTEVVPAQKILSHIKTETDIPDEIKDKLIRTILLCRIGNGVSYNGGVSPGGRKHYENFLEKLGDGNISLAIKCLYAPEIHSSLDSTLCKRHAVAALEILKKNAISPKLNQIIDHLISRGDMLYQALKDTTFKKLAASHIEVS